MRINPNSIPQSIAGVIDGIEQELAKLDPRLEQALEPILDLFEGEAPAPKAAPTTKPEPAHPVSHSPASHVSSRDPASFYLTQNRTRYNPQGSINGNCGPTSLAMAALAFGKLPPGTSKARPEQLIERVRIDMTGADNIHSGTTSGQVLRGARKLGLSAQSVNFAGMNRALAQGKMVVCEGNPGAYGKEPGWHFVLITGRTKNGDYIMNDPAYEGRPGVLLTPKQMAHYFRYGVAVGA